MRQREITRSLTFSGRTFSVEELQLIQDICTNYTALGSAQISRTVCELLQWKRPSGRLKNHECRLLLERLQKLELVDLLEVRRTGRHGSRTVRLTSQSDPKEEISGSVGQFEPLRLDIVETDADGESRLWRELIERYHYLHYRVPVGATKTWTISWMRDK